MASYGLIVNQFFFVLDIVLFILMECNSPNDYCFNLKVLTWEAQLGPKYAASNTPSYGCLANEYSNKYNCPPTTVARLGIDGWPAVNASATMDGLTTGIGVTPYPTYGNGKKLTAIYRATIGGEVRVAPKGTKFLVNYQNLKYKINIELYGMNTFYNVGIEDIKGSEIIYYRWIVRDTPL